MREQKVEEFWGAAVCQTAIVRAGPLDTEFFFRPQRRANVLLLGLLAAASGAACETDPVYLASTAPPVVADNSSRAPFECDEGTENCFVDAGVPRSELERLFGRPENAVTQAVNAPTWIYPLDRSLHPRNLGLLTLHFSSKLGSDAIYELILESGAQSRRIYFPCLSAGGEGCLYRMPEAFWTSAATAFAGQEIKMILRAATRDGISSESTLQISLSPQDVIGGLYYWSSNLQGIYRLIFGGREAVPYVQIGSDADPQCAGCHAVSRDGSTVAFTQGSADPDGDVFENAAFDGLLKVARVTSLDAPLIDPASATASDSAMMSLSRTGIRVATAFDGKLELRDSESGAVLDEVYADSGLSGLTPLFPEFSPDDKKLVVTLSDGVESEIGVTRGSIATISIQGDVFGEVTELVPGTSSLAHYYPSWSPDGKWVAFVSGPAGKSSYDQENARLRLVSVETKEIFDLNHASGPAGTTSTWPKFTPFIQCREGGDCPEEESIFFLSYSSKREYGLLANQPGKAVRSQLWMSAILVEQTAQGLDPSTPPFWVPYQSPDSANHLGYWTEALRCNEAYGCGFGQLCQDGECVIVVR